MDSLFLGRLFRGAWSFSITHLFSKARTLLDRSCCFLRWKNLVAFNFIPGSRSIGLILPFTTVIGQPGINKVQQRPFGQNRPFLHLLDLSCRSFVRTIRAKELPRWIKLGFIGKALDMKGNRTASLRTDQHLITLSLAAHYTNFPDGRLLNGNVSRTSTLGFIHGLSLRAESDRERKRDVRDLIERNVAARS